MARRIQIFLVAIPCFIAVSSVKSQITGNLSVKDPKALPIDEVAAKKLTSNKWLGLKIIETRRGETRESAYHASIEFPSNGEYKRYGGDLDGTWEIVNQQFIKLTRTPRRYRNPSELNGSYSIYEIGDSTLTLAQVLTSSGDWVKQFIFTISKREYDETHKLTHSKTDYSNYGSRDFREGKVTEYYPNGSIHTVGFNKLIRISMSKEEMFERNIKSMDSSLYIYKPLPTGDWITYFPDGKTQSIRHYDDNGKAIGVWINYYFDGKIESVTYNTISNHYRDKYEYRSNGSVLQVKREQEGQTIYVLGKKDSIGLSQINFHERTRAGAIIKYPVQMKNFSTHPMEIRIGENRNLGVQDSIIRLNSLDSIEFNLRVKTPNGSVHEKIQLSTQEWKYDITFNSFGYHLCDTDFDATSKKIILPTKFYYYITAEEYQLEIEKLNSGPKKKTIPFSQQLSEIELSKGIYNLTLWGSFGKRTKTVEVR